MAKGIQNNDLMSTLEASRILGLGAERVRQLAKEGLLPAEMIRGGFRVFKRSDVERLKRVRDKAKSAAA